MANMYTTIVIVDCKDKYVDGILYEFLVKEYFAEIDQEFEDITQYTIISKHEPDFTPFEDLVHKHQFSEPNVQYVTVGFENAYINATRRYCGTWYND